MPGYSKLALTVSQEGDKFKCTQCKQYLRNPHQSQCGHRFCYTCIEELVRERGKGFCLVCIKEDPESPDAIMYINQANPDFAIKREMRNLPAKCLNNGCVWSGIFQAYMDHEVECVYALVICPGCSQEIMRQERDNHLTNYCLLRLITCKYCNVKISFKDLKVHEQNQCTKFPVMCQFCAQRIPRDKLQEHTDAKKGNCARTRQRCKYYVLGCNQTVEDDKQTEHDIEETEHHMHLLLEKISNYKISIGDCEINNKEFHKLSKFVTDQEKLIETLHVRVSDFENELRRLTMKGNQSLTPDNSKDAQEKIEQFENVIKNLKKKVDVLESKFATDESIIGVLNGEVERGAELVQSVKMEEKRIRQPLEAVEKKAKAQDRIIALKDVALAEQDLRIQSLEMASYDGILTWKISDFARKRRDAISGRTLSLYSPYFFSSRFGYKMCARVYLNGDGMGKGNHISLFFVIMKGEYDAILKWPFRQKVTFMWIDQNNQEHVIDAFRPDPNSISFKRPTGDLNVASGCPLFLPLSLLDSDKHAYVKDNVAFIRISVDTSDL